MDALSRLQRLYAMLPTVACKGLCGHSCHDRIDATDVERAVLTERGVDLDARQADGACAALSKNLVATGSCTVHEVRPLICRLWGVAQAMPCPHGCTAQRLMDDREILMTMARAHQVGGHRDAMPLDALRKALEDPATTALMARMLRGDRAARPLLAASLGLPA